MLLNCLASSLVSSIKVRERLGCQVKISVRFSRSKAICLMCMTGCIKFHSVSGQKDCC